MRAQSRGKVVDKSAAATGLATSPAASTADLAAVACHALAVAKTVAGSTTSEQATLAMTIARAVADSTAISSTAAIRAARIVTARVAHATRGLTRNATGRVAAAHHFFAGTAGRREADERRHKQYVFH
jgi:hypothetical protein